MIYRFVFFLLSVLFLNISFGQDQVVIGQKKVIHSDILQEDRTYQIYLPESYNWALDRSYPVLYVLDGESHFLHTTGSVSYLSSQGEIPELIVVAITSTIRIRDFTQTDWPTHWIGGGGAVNFKSFLSDELLPTVEKNFRTNGFRILSGHSAGGQFALYCLTSQPSLFNAYFAFSPSLDWDNNLPQRSLEESFIKTDSLRSFLYVARSDDFGEALADYTRLVETLELHSPKGFRWISDAFPDETHSSIPLLAQINALRKLFTGYRLHNDFLSNGITYAEKHFQEVSGLAGYEIQIPENIINNLGYEALEMGEIQKAILLFKRNITQNPNSANAFDSMADAYEEAGMWNEALISSERAVELARKYNNPNLSYFIEHTKKINEHQKLNNGK
jgi:uncharacterized protein